MEISGVWKACPPGKEQTHELQTTDVNVLGKADPEVHKAFLESYKRSRAVQLTIIIRTDVPHPEKVSQPRLPSSDSPPPHAHTFQLPPLAVPIGMLVPARKCVSLRPEWGLRSGPPTVNHIVGL